MALVHCPECGRDVSDMSPVCIHCGYPLQKDSSTLAAYQVTIPSSTEYPAQKIAAIKVVRETTKLGLADAKELVERPSPVVVKDGLTKDQADYIVNEFKTIGIAAKMNSSAPRVANAICCPRCGSTEYHAGARGYSLLAGFIGSGKTVLTCLKCGHRWEPRR